VSHLIMMGLQVPIFMRPLNWPLNWKIVYYLPEAVEASELLSCLVTCTTRCRRCQRSARHLAACNSFGEAHAAHCRL